MEGVCIEERNGSCQVGDSQSYTMNKKSLPQSYTLTLSWATAQYCSVAAIKKPFFI